MTATAFQARASGGAGPRPGAGPAWAGPLRGGVSGCGCRLSGRSERAASRWRCGVSKRAGRGQALRRVHETPVPTGPTAHGLRAAPLRAHISRTPEPPRHAHACRPVRPGSLWFPRYDPPHRNGCLELAWWSSEQSGTSPKAVEEQAWTPIRTRSPQTSHKVVASLTQDLCVSWGHGGPEG